MQLTKTITSALITLSLIASPITAASTVQAGGEPVTPMQALVAKLGVTDKQKADAFALIADHQSKIKTMDMETFISLKKKQMQLLTKPAFDEAEYEKIVLELQKHERTMVLSEAKLKNKIYNLLTPEQQEEFKAILQKQLAR